MALNSFKPCSRVMRSSPNQTDQQQKEVYYLLQDPEQHHQAEEAKKKEHLYTHRKAFCEEPFPISKACDPSCKEDLPTFIAHQGFAPVRLKQKIGCKSDKGHTVSGWFKKEQQYNEQFLCPLFQKDSSQSFCHVPPEVPTRTQKLRFLGRDSSKQSGEQDHHTKQNKQRSSHNKNACASGNNYCSILEWGTSAREELGIEKRRSSSASVEDMVRYRDAMRNKGRSYDGRSSWEEEVRQAMARGLINTKQSEEPHGLQRSTSVKDYGTSVLPSTLLVKKTGGIGSDAACLEAGLKFNEPDGRPLRKTNAMEADMWRGLNVKSPSEERWEEAAEVEERQELQRRARSQSMRYDTGRSAELTCVSGPWDTRSSGNEALNEDEWAVNTKSGYVNVQPHASGGTFAAPACCRSLLGRSLSMRDTRMGLVMECAACGAALHGAGGRLLCFCSCCAANRAASIQGGMATTIKKKNGILRACRRLLGLGKKRGGSEAQI